MFEITMEMAMQMEEYCSEALTREKYLIDDELIQNHCCIGRTNLSAKKMRPNAKLRTKRANTKFRNKILSSWQLTKADYVHRIMSKEELKTYLQNPGKCIVNLGDILYYRSKSRKSCGVIDIYGHDRIYKNELKSNKSLRHSHALVGKVFDDNPLLSTSYRYYKYALVWRTNVDID